MGLLVHLFGSSFLLNKPVLKQVPQLESCLQSKHLFSWAVCNFIAVGFVFRLRQKYANNGSLLCHPGPVFLRKGGLIVVPWLTELFYFVPRACTNSYLVGSNATDRLPSHWPEVGYIATTSYDAQYRCGKDSGHLLLTNLFTCKKLSHATKFKLVALEDPGHDTTNQCYSGFIHTFAQSFCHKLFGK